MTTNQWRDYFKENPNDWPSHLIMADWLEESGNDFLARAARYMGRQQKRPDRYDWSDKVRTYWWWTESEDFEPTHQLPANLCDYKKYCTSWWQAIAFLARRLKEVAPE